MIRVAAGSVPPPRTLLRGAALARVETVGGRVVSPGSARASWVQYQPFGSPGSLPSEPHRDRRDREPEKRPGTRRPQDEGHCGRKHADAHDESPSGSRQSRLTSFGMRPRLWSCPVMATHSAEALTAPSRVFGTRTAFSNQPERRESTGAPLTVKYRA